MKIGIITQPLAINYGGLLQNYALQKVLVSLGHEVYTINRSRGEAPKVYNSNLYIRSIFFVRQLLKRMIGRPAHQTYREYIRIRKNCINFVKKYINVTDDFIHQEGLYKIIGKYKFKGYVVGSDQVWRPRYSHNIYNDYLDFCQDEKDVKRIAYAASFGVNDWEYNDEQTNECGRLLNLFDAVSVREDSGIDLCEKYWGISASLALDPTLLLEKEDYIRLVEQEAEQKSQGELFCYILDRDESIDVLINEVEKKTSMIAFQVRAKKKDFIHKKGEDINDYIIPSPTKWLRAFMDAKMVITDSFHGCIFSIIFNKPFWVIGNNGRGNARFDSLLRLFNLEDRKVTLDQLLDVDINSNINWEEVNITRKKWQEKSMYFLSLNL